MVGRLRYKGEKYMNRLFISFQSKMATKRDHQPIHTHRSNTYRIPSYNYNKCYYTVEEVCNLLNAARLEGYEEGFEEG